MESLSKSIKTTVINKSLDFSVVTWSIYNGNLTLIPSVLISGGIEYGELPYFKKFEDLSKLEISGDPPVIGNIILDINNQVIAGHTLEDIQHFIISGVLKGEKLVIKHIQESTVFPKKVSSYLNIAEEVDDKWPIFCKFT